MAQKFQKLDIDLPKQPLSDQKVWTIAGWLLALLIVVLTLYTYFDYRNDGGSFQEMKNNVYEAR